MLKKVVFPYYFIGSKPPREKGLQRKMRKTVSFKALKKEYFKKASWAYSEQVGL